LPKDVYEDELIPLFEKCGKIWDLRIMMNPLEGQNKGYCFITFCDRRSAESAVAQVSYSLSVTKDLSSRERGEHVKYRSVGWQLTIIVTNWS
jgi:RNA recognition motif-containing protein